MQSPRFRMARRMQKNAPKSNANSALVLGRALATPSGTTLGI